MAHGWPLSHEVLPVVGRITPQTITAAATEDTDVVDMSKWQEVLIIFNMGAYAGGNDGSVVVKVEISNSNDGSNPVDLTGKALTTANFTGSALDDAVGVIRVRADELTVSGTEYRYLFCSVTPSDQNLTAGVVILGVAGRQQPGTDYDLAAVKEIVA